MRLTSGKVITADPAGVFAVAHSLWNSIFEVADRCEKSCLSEAYNGLDQLMREAIRVGTVFEEWSCRHIAFGEFDEVWPYFIADNFGRAWLSVDDAYSLASFNDDDCLRVAWELRLPIKPSNGIILPVDVRVPHPNPLSPFVELRIQTFKTSAAGMHTKPFTSSDELFDEEFSTIGYSLHGELTSGELEHIADRSSYAELVALMQKLIPGVQLPSAPTSRREGN